MKYLLVIGLLFASLVMGGCSSAEIKGSYKGKLDVEGAVDNNVIALVKVEGKSRSVTFEDASLLSYCMNLKEGGAGQTCAVEVNGKRESLTTTNVYFTGASSLGPGGAMIVVEGITVQSKTVVRISFSGLPYSQK